MKKILKRFAKDKQSSATLEFYVVPGRALFVCAEDFRRAGAGSEERMKVSNYIVSEKWSGANAYVIGRLVSARRTISATREISNDPC
jgi:hypothetical protein